MPEKEAEFPDLKMSSILEEVVDKKEPVEQVKPVYEMNDMEIPKP